MLSQAAMIIGLAPSASTAPVIPTSGNDNTTTGPAADISIRVPMARPPAPPDAAPIRCGVSTCARAMMYVACESVQALLVGLTFQGQLLVPCGMSANPLTRENDDDSTQTNLNSGEPLRLLNCDKHNVLFI